MNNLYLVSTTAGGWNEGDDLIREGVMRLLGFDKEMNSLLWLNRAQLTLFEKRSFRYKTRKAFAWSFQSNIPHMDTIFPTVQAFIVAGSPDWLSTLESVYKRCLEHGVPILIIGVRTAQGKQNIELLKECKDLVQVCTVRDQEASEYTRRAGIRPTLYLDPAFHANYNDMNQDIDLALNCRTTWSGKHKEEYVQTYRNIYEKYQDRISIITTHEVLAYVYATKEFGKKKVFFSSDSRAYKDIYSRCKYFIGGRLHGAFPSAANGAQVHLIHAKYELSAVSNAREYIKRKLGYPTIHVYDNENKGKNLERNPKTGPALVKEIVKAEFSQHRDYIRDRIQQAG